MLTGARQTSAPSGGSARGYQALSKLSAVGESRMPVPTMAGVRGQLWGPAASPAHPPCLLAGSPWWAAWPSQRRWRRVYCRGGAGAVPGPLWRRDRKIVSARRGS